MTDEQKAKLNELIAAGTALVEADSSLTTLKAHIDEARALLENADATSAQAEELIAELTELIAEANPGSKTANGEAAVQTFGYTAKVSVSYDTATGKILSVSDNGTEPGTNSTFWQNAIALFAKLIGKTRAEVAGVDGISGATLSSNAIKEAVQSVLPEVEAPSEDLAAWAAYEGGFETFLSYMGEMQRSTRPGQRRLQSRTPQQTRSRQCGEACALRRPKDRIRRLHPCWSEATR